MSSNLLDIPQAAQRLGVSESLVRRYCREKRLGQKLGSRWIIALDQLERFEQQERKVGRPPKPSP